MSVENKLRMAYYMIMLVKSPTYVAVFLLRVLNTVNSKKQK